MGIFNRIQNEIEERGKEEGITPADLLDLSEELRGLMTFVIRQGEMTVAQAAKQLGEKSLDDTQQTLNTLVEKGYLQREERKEGWVYSTRFARKRGLDLPVGIWSALGQRTSEE